MSPASPPTSTGTPRATSSPDRSLRRRLAVPLACAAWVALAAFGASLYAAQYRAYRRRVESQLASLRRTYGEVASHEAQMLTSAAMCVRNDRVLALALARRDRRALLAGSEDLFARLREDFDVTHFYFHDDRRVCLLRVHRPDRHGDLIRRPSARKAERSAEPSWGTDVGPLGTLTLRAVLPWKVNGRLAGYVELGKEIDAVVHETAELTGLEVAALVRRDLLSVPPSDQAASEALGPASPRPGPGDHLIYVRTPGFVEGALDGMPVVQGSTKALSADGRRYAVAGTPIRDAGEMTVGCLVAMRDVTDALGDLRRSLWRIVIVCLLVGGVTTLSLHMLMRSVWGELSQGRARLERARKGLGRQVARRRRALASQRDALRLLEDVLDALPLPIFHKDRLERYTGCNRAFADAVLGMEPREILGQRAEELLCIPEDQAATYAQRDRDLLAEGGVQVYEAPVTCADGTERFYRFHKALLTGPGGQVEGLVGAMTDVTDWRAERQRSDRARREADEARRSPGELLSGVSPEIHNRLSSVIGLAELLAQTGLDPRQRRHVEDLLTTGGELAELVHDVLDHTRLRAGELELDPQPFDLRGCLEDVIESVWPVAREKRLRVLLRYPPAAPSWFVGDRSRVANAIRNILRQSLRQTHEGHVLIDVSAQVDGPAAHLRIRVEDSAQDADPAWLDRLLAPPGQDSGPIRSPKAGELSLIHSRLLVERMGGRVWVRAVRGTGCTFHVELPLVTSVDCGLDEPIAVEHLAQTRVLVVDDCDLHRAILEETLRGWRMDTRVASGAMEAMAILSAPGPDDEPFGLVLAKSDMSPFGGADLLDMLARKPHLDVECVLMEPAADVPSDRPGGTGHVVTRPVRRDELAKVLLRALGHAPPDEQKGAKPSLSEARSEGGGLRILLAQADPRSRQVTCEMLQGMGHRVTAVGDGGEAVAASCEVFDVAMLDLQMPRVGGFEAAAAIRAQQDRQGARWPILALTAHAMGGHSDICLRGGMDGCVGKPITLRGLSEALHHAVRCARSQTAGERGRAASEAESEQDPGRWRGGVSDDRGALEAFVESASRLGDRLLDAVDRQDLPSAASTAARLRQAAQRAGGEMLALAAEMLEHHAASGDGELVRGSVVGVMTELQDLLEKTIDRLGPRDAPLAASLGDSPPAGTS